MAHPENTEQSGHGDHRADGRYLQIDQIPVEHNEQIEKQARQQQGDDRCGVQGHVHRQQPQQNEKRQ